MQYRIYRVNNNLKGLRWWRNYDNNNKGFPNITIETYLENNNIEWEVLQGRINTDVKYQPIDNLNLIEIYIDDFKNVPDYIKVEFTLDSGIVDKLYYYVADTPFIYNSKDKLSCSVKYVMDKWASFMHPFHNYFANVITTSPQVFFVKKHYPRTFKNTSNKYTINYIKQPWLYNIDNSINGKLIPIGKNTYDPTYLATNSTKQYSDTYASLISTEYRVNSGTLEHKLLTDPSWNNYTDCGSYSSPSSAWASATYIFNDDIFKENNIFEYYIIKPTVDVIKGLDTLWIVPVRKATTGVSNDNFGINNLPDNLRMCPTAFSENNIIGRFTHNLSPIAIACLCCDKSDFKNHLLHVNDSSDTSPAFECIVTRGIPRDIELEDNTLINKLKTLYNNFNGATPNYKKIKANNPHLLAPQYCCTEYLATTNNVSSLTADYIKVDDTIKVYLNTGISSEWSTRLITNNWNEDKELSQSGSELTIADNRQAPVECSAWNNNYLQRNILDTGRNTLVRQSNASIVGSSLGVAGSIASLFFGPIGWFAGISGLISSGLGLAKSNINLQNGLAQNEAQMKNLFNAPSSYNPPITNLGLSYYSTWANQGLIIYTMGLTEQEATIVNNNDNMFGYKVEQWDSYDKYLTCWHGNYMLIDVSKNYTTLFKILKDAYTHLLIGSSDTYINEFLNALNNGITLFENGIYRDLATDENNWEREFSAPTE